MIMCDVNLTFGNVYTYMYISSIKTSLHVRVKEVVMLISGNWKLYCCRMDALVVVRVLEWTKCFIL